MLIAEDTQREGSRVTEDEGFQAGKSVSCVAGRTTETDRYICCRRVYVVLCELFVVGDHDCTVQT